MRFREYLVQVSLWEAMAKKKVEVDPDLLRLYDEILVQAATLTPRDGLPWEIFREQWGR